MGDWMKYPEGKHSRYNVTVALYMHGCELGNTIDTSKLYFGQ